MNFCTEYQCVFGSVMAVATWLCVNIITLCKVLLNGLLSCSATGELPLHWSSGAVKIK